VDSYLLEVRAEVFLKAYKFLKIPSQRLLGQDASLVAGHVHGALSHFSAHHEADETQDDGLHIPGGVPQLRVEVTEAGADMLSLLEAAIRRNHLNSWRLEGVFMREVDFANVVATRVLAVFQAEDAEVPLPHLVSIGRSDEVG